MKTIGLRHSMLFAAGLLAVLAFTLGAAPAEADSKKYYLTPEDTFQGNAVLTACQPGYHMASIYELLDLGSLKYETKLGLTRDDSGSGPPAERGGWIRTGERSSNADDPGRGNCNAWTSNASTDYGTVVELESDLGVPVDVYTPFDGSTLPCDSSFRVWCKQN